MDLEVSDDDNYISSFYFSKQLQSVYKRIAKLLEAFP
jgi:hypothetical protein